MTVTESALRVLDRETWAALEHAHEVRADSLTARHRERRRAGRSHPVEDFLFTYYSLRPAQLRRWHPGAGVGLAKAAGFLGRRWYAEVEPGVVGVDVSAYLADRGELVSFVSALLSATTHRPAQLGCFGLHEWAMVYRLRLEEVRHESWPLRLGPAATDQVVETHHVRCSHYDAVRFFTPDAVSRNAVRPTRERQVALEQPGCLHATMDLYKWAYKLGPIVPGELLLDCFQLARDVRVLDMRASPYDLTDLGYSPVRIETTEGKHEYVSAQRRFAERAGPLRHRLLGLCRGTAGQCVE